MAKNKIKWLKTEYAGGADETIQLVLVNKIPFYVYFYNGYYYVFASIYSIHLYWSGVNGNYLFTCETEADLIEYLENELTIL